MPGADTAPIEQLLRAAPDGDVGLREDGGRLSLIHRPGPEPRLLAATSGSTGPAKWFHRGQESWIASFHVNADHFGIGPARRVATLGGPGATLPLYGALEALHLGARLWMLHALRPDRQMRTLASERVDLLWATPVQLRQLSHAAARRALPPAPCLRDLLIGGAALDDATRTMARTLFPNAALHQFYGASETSFIALSGPDTPPGAVGAAYAGVEIVIRSPEGETLGPGREGVIWVRSPYLFGGYEGGDAAGNPDLRREDGYLSIGERGILDPATPGAAPVLRLTGRSGRVVQVNDRVLRLDMAESDLRRIPGVEEAAIVPLADARRGTVIEAHLLLAPEAGYRPWGALRACRAALGPRCGLRRAVLHRDWPRLASGKTDYAALAADSGGDTDAGGHADGARKMPGEARG
ncbi:long-chain acyl-CoA synthetase [Profundibacterium mesophilum KAUST100406-0324]|uniref:Long-chain acyl-CoA synthetase n=2 Tax=Profundibacterium TaxID=1258570 RepID=A0A921NUV3_9RHOB|nr:long-chain acyl-CoA synthetase [Profundibacterium mesophilum KAUST100406-0324]